MNTTTAPLIPKIYAGHSKFGTSMIVVERPAAIAERTTKK
jgi:hypothetical protein